MLVAAWGVNTVAGLDHHDHYVFKSRDQLYSCTHMHGPGKGARSKQV